MGFRKILLIDDDEDDQEIFMSVVKEIAPGIQCSYSDNAKEALQKLLSNEILQPEAIFLDLNMPVMNGQEFLANIKKDEKLRQIPVIIFTTSSDPNTKRVTKDLGAYDYITKPTDINQLVYLLTPFLS